jgi:mono/diheme cytochrome c family protein
MDYPIWDVAMGGGVLMGVVAVVHVVVAHFAIGGGLLVVVTETLATRRDDVELRELARRSSLVLVLLSTVVGAATGVGIWVVAGLISPGAISALIHTYVWGWAMEWVFLVVEIVAALIYATTWGRISRAAHLLVGWVYLVAAYASLVIINGIVTFMLTPGRWLETSAFWDGFFNPTYWPSLVLRTGIAVLLAAIVMLFVAVRSGEPGRQWQVRYLGGWLLGGGALSYGGYRWWEASLPEGVRGLFLGDSALLATLAGTRHLLLWSLAVSLALAVVALLAVPKLARTPTAILLALTAVGFFGGYERLREGVRKPYLISDHLFANGLRVADIARVNEDGLAASSGWVARVAGEDPAVVGREVFRVQCSSCHTLDGYQAIRPLLPKDPDMIAGPLFALKEMGEAWVAAPPGGRVDPAGLDYPFMPPLVGTDDEVMALAEYLATLTEGGAR